MAAILRVRLADGTVVEVPAIVGPPGKNGRTPVKGKDYWTEEEQAGIVNDVLAALPTWEGGSY